MNMIFVFSWTNDDKKASNYFSNFSFICYYLQVICLFLNKKVARLTKFKKYF